MVEHLSRRRRGHGGVDGGGGDGGDGDGDGDGAATEKRRRRRRRKAATIPTRRFEQLLKLGGALAISMAILWNLYLFGFLSTFTVSRNAIENNNNDMNDRMDPIFILSHKEECFQQQQQQALATTNTTTAAVNKNSETNQKDTSFSSSVLPTGLVVTVLYLDQKNPQLWNSICTLFPSQLTHFIVPHQLDVFLLLIGDYEKEQELVNCMNLQEKKLLHNKVKTNDNTSTINTTTTITWNNLDGSVTTTRDYYAITVIAGVPYQTNVKIAVQPSMDFLPAYIMNDYNNFSNSNSNSSTSTTTILTQYLKDHPIEPPMCQAPVEYIQGTRWYTNELLHLKLLQNYDYWIKLDPDIVFIEPLPFNFLYDMKKRGALFGHTGEYPANVPAPCSKGIGMAVNIYTLHEPKHSTCAIPKISTLRNSASSSSTDTNTTTTTTTIPDMDRYYTNFVIGNVKFFQSDGVRRFGRWLSEYPNGFFRHRWTDQIFFHTVMQLYLWEKDNDEDGNGNGNGNGRYPQSYIADYTDFRCAPLANCWMSSLDLKNYPQNDVCDNGGLFVHTKHALHWVHRWNRHYARKPYTITEEQDEQQQQRGIYQSKYQNDCGGSKGRKGMGLRRPKKVQ